MSPDPRANVISPPPQSRDAWTYCPFNSVCLGDLGSGFHLWGARYDRPAGNVLAQQSELTSRIVSTLGSTLGLKLAEAKGGNRTSSGSASMIFGLGIEYLGRIAKEAIFLPVDLYNRVTNSTTVQSRIRSGNEPA